MKFANVALVSIVVVGLAAAGCNKEDDSAEEGSLDMTEAQLVEDDSEATETDDDLEAGLDEPLSGADDANPGDPADGKTVGEIMEKVRVNPGNFFKPAGCIESSPDGDNKIKHVFKGCRGPYDMAEFNGTITSTYTYDSGKLTVTHEASGFTANGASITGSRVVEYTRAGSVVTKTRHGNWTGTTAKGRPISHVASFVTTYDTTTKCLTRDGKAQSTVGDRAFERTVDNFKRCGIGRLGCPESGTVSLTKTKSDQELTLTLTIDFLGGAEYKVTRPSGRVVTRRLICRPNA